MLFGVSYGEILLILGAAVVVLGPKDLPFLARNAGRVVGRAASYVASARNQALAFADAHEVTKLHKELQDSMQQLEAIRRELRSGISVFEPPGPITRRLLQGALGQPNPTATDTGAQAADQTMEDTRDRVAEFVQRHHRLTAQPKAPASDKAPAATGLAHTVLPVSAIAAGRAPKREGQTPSGSDIMLDALAEEEVALAAMRFMQSQRT